MRPHPPSREPGACGERAATDLRCCRSSPSARVARRARRCGASSAALVVYCQVLADASALSLLSGPPSGPQPQEVGYEQAAHNSGSCGPRMAHNSRPEWSRNTGSADRARPGRRVPASRLSPLAASVASTCGPEARWRLSAHRAKRTARPTGTPLTQGRAAFAPLVGGTLARASFPAPCASAPAGSPVHRRQLDDPAVPVFKQCQEVPDPVHRTHQDPFAVGVPVPHPGDLQLVEQACDPGAVEPAASRPGLRRGRWNE
jgi:hypothetical protein